METTNCKHLHPYIHLHPPYDNAAFCRPILRLMHVSSEASANQLQRVLSSQIIIITPKLCNSTDHVTGSHVHNVRYHLYITDTTMQVIMLCDLLLSMVVACMHTNIRVRMDAVENCINSWKVCPRSSIKHIAG